MGKSDVEMEDAEEHFHGSGSDVKQSETEVFDGKIEYEGENISPVATNSGDSNKCGNVDEDMIKLRNEPKDQATDKSEIVEQSSLERETNQPMNAEESTEQQIYSKNEKEQSSINIIGDEQHAARSTVEKQTGSTDAMNKVIEQNGINGRIKQGSSSETGVEGRNPVQKVIEENPSRDVAAEKQKDTGKEDENCVDHVASKEVTNEIADTGNDPKENRPELSCNEAPKSENVVVDMLLQCKDRELEDAANVKEGKAANDGPREQCKNIQLANPVTDGDAKTVETSTKHEGDGFSLPNQHEAAATPNSLIRDSVAKAADHTEESVKTAFTQVAQPLTAEDDDGTPEDQEAFMKELENFYRERAMDFKPPKFYGQPLNCLKLWRAVLRLGGYDRVTGSKLWRQVGESFHPPKTCTTVSWTFRIFYEKSLLEYEKHKRQSGELQLPVATLPEASGADNEGNGHLGSGSGRARSNSAARSMQGWHAQRLFGYGEDKSLSNVGKREKNVKSIGSLKQKRPNEVDHSIKAARTETSKQLATSVVDVGPPADWVKINVRQNNDCFEVYALVPGLLREEVRVQSDPAGRVVITGQPEQADNPWGITPFKKVVSLPTRIDPLQTSAVVSLHGRLFVRAPFEQPNI